MGWDTLIHGPPAPAALLIAIVLDIVVGDPRWLPHPVRLIGALVAFLDARLNRERFGESGRAVRGALAAALVAGASAAAGWFVTDFAGRHEWGWLAELALVTLLLAQRDMIDHGIRVVGALGAGVEPGRAAVRHIVGRDVRALDEHGVARAAIESCAESYADGVVAPIFWYLLLGLPGLLAYKAINTMDSMIGHRSPRHRAFGLAAARLDDVANWVPARIGGLLIAGAAAFVPGASSGRALRIMLRDARKHDSPNAGWPEAAMAGALGLALLGPRRYGGAAAGGAWLGAGRERATPEDVMRALYVFVVAGGLASGGVAVFGAVALASAGGG